MPDLVDHGVVAAGIEAGDQAVPLAFDELRLDAEPPGDLAADLDVEAGELAGAVVIGEGRVGAFGADTKLAGSLDLRQGRGVAGSHRERLQRSRGNDRLPQSHVFFLCLSTRNAVHDECRRVPAAVRR